jgi:glycosyltransferase involved in cell wall biosynthesis
LPAIAGRLFDEQNMSTREDNAAASLRVCVLMPAYNEERHIAEVVREVLKHVPDVVVIDDGSKDRTAEVAEKAGAIVVRQGTNQGKGAALTAGFAYARQHGFEVLITMDADGQHLPDEVPKFVEAYERTGIPVLIGNRMSDLEKMPIVRKQTNLFMSWLLGRVAGQYIPDTQCGFRLYRCDILPLVSTDAGRFAAESEILLNLAHRGVRIDSVRVSTVYGGEQSKIRPIPDTIRFFRMLWKHRRAHGHPHGSDAE